MEGPAWLQTALGYLELQMFEETWEELDELTEKQQQTVETLDLRIRCRLDEQRYEDAFQWCQTMKEHFPEEHIAYIQGAFCLHEMGKTREAQAWLQSGPSSLQVEAKYFYNLGCYDLALGSEESASAWLKQAFEMEPTYLADAMKDPAFEPILARIAEMDDNADEFFS